MAYKIGRSNITSLLNIELPTTIKYKIISICSESSFKNISNETLLTLLNHESMIIRKAASLITVRSFSGTRIKEVLNEYINNENTTYYNTVHWLDLGASLSRHDAKKIALAVSKNIY